MKVHWQERLQFAVLHKRKISLLMVGVSVIITAALLLFDSGVERTNGARNTIRVKVVSISSTTERAVVSGYGTVEPSKVLQVRPQVAGHVQAMHSQLQEGGRIAGGEQLVQIDPRDYEIQVENAKATVVKADSELRIEKGNQSVAAEEWRIFVDQSDDVPRDKELALRLPQLKEKEAALRSAQSELRRAELTRERTTVLSPFAAIVLEESVEIGSFLDPSSAIAKLASLDQFYVKVRVSDETLRWIAFDEAADGVSTENQVTVTQRIHGGSEVFRTGKLERLLGSVESSGRMVQLLVSIDKPLELNNKAPPLLLGSYVRVDVLGKEVSSVYRLPKRAVREQNKVYVADRQNYLRIRSPEILFSSGESIIVSGAIKEGDRVITSLLQNPLEGSRLKAVEEREAP